LNQELLQWLCAVDSSINMVKIISFIVSIISLLGDETPDSELIAVFLAFDL